MIFHGTFGSLSTTSSTRSISPPTLRSPAPGQPPSGHTQTSTGGIDSDFNRRDYGLFLQSAK